ncbi:hypothetical protein, partial [Pontibacter fetidus]|uniref:hypothetical protein n=1 Tax=Pontibacter fetidus TaxID=2700082 RepID=UPI001F40E6AD
ARKDAAKRLAFQLLFPPCRLPRWECKDTPFVFAFASGQEKFFQKVFRRRVAANSPGSPQKRFIHLQLMLFKSLFSSLPSC